MCVPVSATQRRHGLRSAVRGDLEVPRCNLARYGPQSFCVSGPSLWNSLPLTVRDSSLTNTVLYEAKDISVYSSLRDITIAPPWQPLTYLLTYLLTYSDQANRLVLWVRRKLAVPLKELGESGSGASRGILDNADYVFRISGGVTNVACKHSTKDRQFSWKCP